jgi:hypothetical protein
MSLLHEFRETSKHKIAIKQAVAAPLGLRIDRPETINSLTPTPIYINKG